MVHWAVNLTITYLLYTIVNSLTLLCLFTEQDVSVLLLQFEKQPNLAGKSTK